MSSSANDSKRDNWLPCQWSLRICLCILGKLKGALRISLEEIEAIPEPVITIL
jgi:hypothetical protein